MAKQIKKSPAGRKAIEDKKVVVNLFIRQSELDKRGGKEEVQKSCYDIWVFPQNSVQRSGGWRSLPTLEHKTLTLKINLIWKTKL